VHNQGEEATELYQVIGGALGSLDVQHLPERGCGIYSLIPRPRRLPPSRALSPKNFDCEKKEIGEPQAGFEPTTFRLLSGCSTPKLLWQGQRGVGSKLISLMSVWPNG
jgi:hypothetical protein